MSKETKQIITILLLIFFPIVGLILMFLWGLWSKTVRFVILGIYLFLVLISIIAIVVGGIALAGLVGDDLSNDEATSKTYAVGDTAKANGIEFTLNEFATYQVQDTFLEETSDYCAISYDVKNTGDNELTLSTFTDFELKTTDGEVISQYFLFGEEYVTQPEGLRDFSETSGVELDPDQMVSYFYPFDCGAASGDYELEVRINEFGEYILDDTFAPITYEITL
jgi:hypothetical protein